MLFSKHLDFLLNHSQIILEWLESKEFKEQYIKTNHPYPPLLNPKRLYKKESIEVKSQREDKESKEELSKQQGDNIQENLKPYANLSYESIPASLAWDLNLPLPATFLWITPHGAGATAFYRYLIRCCGVSCILPRIELDGKGKYCNNYRPINNGEAQVISISEFVYTKDYDKYLSLFNQNLPIVFTIRDPIGLIKHVYGRDARGFFAANKRNKTKFNLTHNWHNYSDFLKPSKRSMYDDDFRYMKRFCFIYSALIKYFNTRNIYYIDMSEISQQRAFETMTNLAHKFGFNPPSEESKMIFKMKEFRGYIRYLLPLRLYANKADIPNLFKKDQENKENFLIDEKNSVVLTLNRLQNDKNVINILPQIIQNDLCNDMGVYVSKEHLEILENDKEFYSATKEYLKDFCEAIKEELDRTEEMMLKEKDVLEYLRDNTKVKENLKAILDEELIHIKEVRPDIVKSWKYYQEFLRICEGEEEC